MTLLDTVALDSRIHHDPPGARWVAVCRADALEPGWGEAALAGTRQVALVSFGAGELYAVSHLDPHSGAPVMARGIVGSRWVEGQGHRPTIASPLLKQVYDLGTGRCFSDPELSLE